MADQTEKKDPQRDGWIRRIFGAGGSNARTGPEMAQEQRDAQAKYGFRTIKRDFQTGPVTFHSAGVKDITYSKAQQSDVLESVMYSGDANPMAILRPGGGKHINPEKAMANNNGFVYAAVNAKGREVMSIDWRLYEVNGKNHKEKTEHDLLDLLDSVNPYLTGPELKYLTSSHLDLVGNCYWLLTDKKGNPCKSPLEKPDAIWPLDASKTRPVIDTSSFPFRIKEYVLQFGTSKYIFPTSAIVHFRLPDPENFFEGVGIVQKGDKYIDLDNYVYEFMRKFFVNGARPAGFLKTEFTAPSQLESIKLGFMEVHEGIDNMNKIAVLPKDVTWLEAGSNMKELNITDIGDSSRDRILSLFGVSKTILGTAESDTNRATAETADYVFSKRVIKPHMQLICSFLNEQLVPRYGDNLYITFIDPVPEDRAARTLEMKTAVGSLPVINVNEAREQFMGLGPIEGGDKLMAPNNFAPVEEIPEGGAPKPEPAGGGGKPAGQPVGDEEGTNVGKRLEKAVAFRPARSKMRTQAKERSSIVKQYGDEIAKKIEEMIGKTKKAKPRDGVEEMVAAAQRRQPEYEAPIAEAVAKVNADQKEAVIKNLSRATKKGRYTRRKAVDPAKLFDIDEWIKITVEAVSPSMAKILQAEGDEAAAQLGATFDSTDAVEAALLASVQKFAESYQATARDTLAAKLNEAIDAGQGLDQLTATVSSVYGDLDDYAAKRVAKTESWRAINQGRVAAYQQAGVKTMKWETSGQDNVCPLCAALNGKVIPVDGAFVEAGESFEVDGMTYTADYGAVVAGNLHPNCACTVVPEDMSLE